MADRKIKCSYCGGTGKRDATLEGYGPSIIVGRKASGLPVVTKLFTSSTIKCPVCNGKGWHKG